MKRYQFRLATVLRVRQLQEDIAKAELLAANRRMSEVAAILDKRIAHYGGLLAEHDGEAEPVGDALARRQLLTLAAAAVVQAAEARRQAERKAVLARDGYLVAARGVSVLERLDERRRDEHRLAVDREEAQVVDDLVVGRHGRTTG